MASSPSRVLPRMTWTSSVPSSSVAKCQWRSSSSNRTTSGVPARRLQFGCWLRHDQNFEKGRENATVVLPGMFPTGTEGGRLHHIYGRYASQSLEAPWYIAG